MGRKHPNQRTRMPCRLKQCEGAAAKPFGFMHPPGGQCEWFGRCRIKLHLRAHLRQQFQASRPAAGVGVAEHLVSARSAIAAILLAASR